MENNKNKSVIELAMERVAREAARKALTSDPATLDALVQRQRKTDSTQTLRAEPATTELHSASPQRSEVQPSRSKNDAIPSALCDVDTHATDRRFGFGSKTLVFAVTIPALIGIGAMMLMTQTARQNKLFLPPTKLVNVAAMASAPAASIPATATITVFPKTAQYEGNRWPVFCSNVGDRHGRGVILKLICIVTAKILSLQMVSRAPTGRAQDEKTCQAVPTLASISAS